MKRREFIRLLGGAAGVWPLAAGAQQGERIRRIGALYILPADDREAQARHLVFQQSLQQLGWTVDRNLQIDIRLAGGNAADVRRYASELVALVPDAILAVGSATVAPLQQATRTIPIVFVNVADPVGAGLIESLSRPGGNTTGFTNFEYSMAGKWVELLKQIAPRLTRAAVLRDSTAAAGLGQLGAISAAAQSLGIELVPVGVGDLGEVERGVTAFARLANGGLIVTTGGTGFRRETIIALALRHPTTGDLSVPVSRRGWGTH
jgi:putative tryptophan/tyrosine transport system substrate-binding protein